MSRPIYEPNLQRTATRLNYGQEQLFRRPAPRGGTPTEWIKAESTTNLGSSFTALDFVESAENSCYDSTIPTFAINGDGNLEIGQDGMYDLYCYKDGFQATFPDQVEVTILRGYRNAGANPIVLGSGSFTSPREVRMLRRASDTSTIIDTGDLQIMPTWYTPLAYFDGDILIDGVTEIEFESYTEIDGVGSADSGAQFNLFCRRIGPGCIPPPE